MRIDASWVVTSMANHFGFGNRSVVCLERSAMRPDEFSVLVSERAVPTAAPSLRACPKDASGIVIDSSLRPKSRHFVSLLHSCSNIRGPEAIPLPRRRALPTSETPRSCLGRIVGRAAGAQRTSVVGMPLPKSGKFEKFENLCGNRGLQNQAAPLQLLVFPYRVVLYVMRVMV